MRASGFLLSLSLALAPAPAHAGDNPATLDREDQAVMASRTFLQGHPDLKYRTEGFLAWDEGRLEEARGHFLKAAEHADKPAQAVLAEMAWKGIGTPVDRAMGYVWADLAAERGYRQFVAQRERYWAQLDEAGRARALEAGTAVLAHYGDAAAKPRLARQMRRAQQGMIRTVRRKDITVRVPGRGGLPTEIRGHDFYADKFWQPEQYFAWVDAVWKDPPAEHVEVGPVQDVDAPGPLTADR